MSFVVVRASWLQRWGHHKSLYIYIYIYPIHLRHAGKTTTPTTGIRNDACLRKTGESMKSIQAMPLIRRLEPSAVRLPPHSKPSKAFPQHIKLSHMLSPSTSPACPTQCSGPAGVYILAISVSKWVSSCLDSLAVCPGGSRFGQQLLWLLRVAII